MKLYLLPLCLLAGCMPGPLRPEEPVDYDVVVVGAGMGGLSAAAHLQVHGLQVLLLEQHHKVGGCTSSFERGGFRFEVALQEMAGGAKGTTLGRLLEEVGVLAKVELIPIPELYRSVFPGLDFTLPARPELAIQALTERWPDEREGIQSFFAVMAAVYEDLAELKEFYRRGPASSFFRALVIPLCEWSLAKHSGQTLAELMDQHLEDPKLKAVISQLWFYYGPPPSRLWAPIFLLANHTYMTEGTYHIRGSSQALANAYAERIGELGGRVRTGVMVARILVEEGEVRGVQTALGESISCRYVVSNADPFQTFEELVGREKAPAEILEKIHSMEPSNSFVGVYLGLDVEPSFWKVTDHEVFLNTSYDADAVYENMMAGRWDQGMTSLTFYSNLGDRYYAPPGKSVLALHAFADARSFSTEPGEYQRQKKRMAEQLIGLAEGFLPGLRQHIVVQEEITPLTLQSYTLNRGGVPYGWAFTPEQWQRLKNQTPIDGLYLAGSWAQPSHGVMGAQVSGYQAARLILDREGL